MCLDNNHVLKHQTFTKVNHIPKLSNGLPFNTDPNWYDKSSILFLEKPYMVTIGVTLRQFYPWRMSLSRGKIFCQEKSAMGWVDM